MFSSGFLQCFHNFREEKLRNSIFIKKIFNIFVHNNILDNFSKLCRNVLRMRIFSVEFSSAPAHPVRYPVCRGRGGGVAEELVSTKKFSPLINKAESSSSVKKWCVI